MTKSFGSTPGGRDVLGTCRLCGADLHHVFVDLGMSPLCESFVAADRIDEGEVTYPLRVLACEFCFLVQLKAYVRPDAIFDDYAYHSSYSSSWVAHAKAYCEAITQRLQLNARSSVVEIASNDGYLLQHFGPLGVPARGIEPAANVAAIAIEKGIETRIDFFGADLAEEMAAEGQQADLIIGNNVLAQVPDLNDFVEGMRILLKPEGVITLEFPHLARLIAETQFDTIYHEHFSYFSLLTIEQIAARHQLRLIDVEELTTHGGSLRVYLVHASSTRPQHPAVPALLAIERAQGLDRVATDSDFAERVVATKRGLLSLLIELKNQGKTICGYGAPGKGNTLLNYCGIGTDFLEFTVDRNPFKHGQLTPGMRIPILPPEAIEIARPDYVLILPWNLKDEIMTQMAHIAAWGGRFIVPIPEPRIVTPRIERKGMAS
ncbi:methyltransferase [Kaistia sp. 32K]|uniref:class I SAM-dependent methyltransferase n=1 Tax=Kaistia sp. 32K TaxID=2795690 RepID=UPI0019152312|nr:class I SAM-dependent methyltransferase [Kaistia sp. 32K]BCP53486.1 methyltransferase [Kaistia sp. 32K]